MSFLGEYGVVLARKWIAGTRMEDGIRASKELNALGESVLLNDLGEGLADRAMVEQAAGEYIRLIDMMKQSKIIGGISVKATQLGMLVSDKALYSNYGRILRRAAEKKVFIWLDMEEYEYVGRTISLYMKFIRKYPDTGICLQSKLRRSFVDMKRIASGGGIIRIVKGAYKYNAGVSYTDADTVTESYIRMMEYLFKHKARFIQERHRHTKQYK